MHGEYKVRIRNANYLPELPISVDEIYELVGAKNKRFNKIYSDIWKMYDNK